MNGRDHLVGDVVAHVFRNRHIVRLRTVVHQQSDVHVVVLDRVGLSRQAERLCRIGVRVRAASSQQHNRDHHTQREEPRQRQHPHPQRDAGAARALGPGNAIAGAQPPFAVLIGALFLPLAHAANYKLTISCDRPVTRHPRCDSVPTAGTCLKSATFAFAPGITAPVVAGELLTERQLLQGMMLPSANNFAETLARWDAGTIDKFVAVKDELVAAGDHDPVVEIAGGRPIFPELSGARLARNRIVDPSDVLRRDPEVIFASWCGKKVKKAAIRSRPGWTAVAAVRVCADPVRRARGSIPASTCRARPACAGSPPCDR